MSKNTKISVDFTFSFGAIEPKRKHRIEKISREGRFRRKQRVQSDFLCYEISHEIIKLQKICQNMRKKRLPQVSKVVWLIQDPCSTVLFWLKNI